MNRIKLICAASLCALAGIVAADELDSSKPFLCSVATVSECLPGGICEQATAESVNAPDFLKIDLKKKTVTGKVLGSDELPPPSKIQHSTTIDEKLFLQGTDEGVEHLRDGLAWSITIDQVNGKMVLTASGDAEAFVIFGACTNL